jgi:hypothetical protein
LPVLVGPSTAVTPAPRARDVRFGFGENDIAITRVTFSKAMVPGAMPKAGSVSQCDGKPVGG